MKIAIIALAILASLNIVSAARICLTESGVPCPLQPNQQTQEGNYQQVQFNEGANVNLIQSDKGQVLSLVSNTPNANGQNEDIIYLSNGLLGQISQSSRNSNQHQTVQLSMLKQDNGLSRQSHVGDYSQVQFIKGHGTPSQLQGVNYHQEQFNQDYRPLRHIQDANLNQGKSNNKQVFSLVPDPLNANGQNEDNLHLARVARGQTISTIGQLGQVSQGSINSNQHQTVQMSLVKQDNNFDRKPLKPGYNPSSQSQEGKFSQGQFNEGQGTSSQLQEGSYQQGQFSEGHGSSSQIQKGSYYQGQFNKGQGISSQLQEGNYQQGQFNEGQGPSNQIQKGSYYQGEFNKGQELSPVSETLGANGQSQEDGSNLKRVARGQTISTENQVGQIDQGSILSSQNQNVNCGNGRC